MADTDTCLQCTIASSVAIAIGGMVLIVQSVYLAFRASTRLTEVQHRIALEDRATSAQVSPSRSPHAIPAPPTPTHRGGFDSGSGSGGPGWSSNTFADAEDDFDPIP